MKQEEAIELVKYLGLEEVESLDEAKEKFSKTWAKSEEITSAVGKVTGSITNVARKAFDFAGVTLADDEIKGKKAEDIIKLGAERAKAVYEEKLSELTTLKSSSGNEELIKKFEKEKDSLTKKLQEKETLLSETMNQFEGFKNEVVSKERKSKIGSTFDKSLSEVKLDPTISSLTLRGFKDSINDKYIIDIEEDESVVVKDKKSGEKITNKAKAGTFMSLKDILEKEATEAGIILKSPHAGKQGQPNPKPSTQAAEPAKTRGIHPRFLGV